MNHTVEDTAAPLRFLLRGFVTLTLFVVCLGTEVFMLPTFRAMISRGGGGEMAGWATAPIALMHWGTTLAVLLGAVMIYRARPPARRAAIATAWAVVDTALVLWLVGVGLFLLDVVITIPTLG